MKTQSIIIIGKALKEQVNEARNSFENYKLSLEKKYHTEWIDKHLDDVERKNLTILKNAYHDIYDACEDFFTHKW